jgi:hypothetical protein
LPECFYLFNSSTRSTSATSLSCRALSAGSDMLMVLIDQPQDATRSSNSLTKLLLTFDLFFAISLLTTSVAARPP